MATCKVYRQQYYWKVKIRAVIEEVQMNDGPTRPICSERERLAIESAVIRWHRIQIRPKC